MHRPRHHQLIVELGALADSGDMPRAFPNVPSSSTPPASPPLPPRIELDRMDKGMRLGVEGLVQREAHAGKGWVRYTGVYL